MKTFLAKYSARSVDNLFPQQNFNVKTVDLSMFYVMTYNTPMDPFTVAKEISQRPEVLYAEPWFIYPVDGISSCTPNDSLRNLQWALTKIMADSAYCMASGDSTISIGIVDTGVQWDHPDLADNIYINPGETGLDAHGNDKRFNGIDDDGDGYIDDWHGWDFGGADYNNPVGDNNPTPTNDGAGHGTHVAGIASARTNNHIGVAGVANNCRVIAIKTGSDNDTRGPGGTPYIVFGFEGIMYAAQRGAVAINCSWGGPGASQFEQEIIDSVTSMGSLVVAAAGNAGTEDMNFPAAYKNVFSVAATGPNDMRASYTQYGETISVSAPGGAGTLYTSATDILNTYYGSTYAILAGTSMASPHAAGLAGLVKAKFPSYTALQIGQQIRVTCDDIYSINTGSTIKYKLGKGRINALRAVTENTWPAIRMVSFRAVDSIQGNNNGLLEPGEIFALKAVFQNYLFPTSAGATITLATYDNNVSMPQKTFPIGSVPTLGTVSNDANPFTVQISTKIAPGHVVQFVLLIDDGNYKDFQLFSILMNPPYATHNVNNVTTTISNNGRLGFNDPPTNSQGVGFVYKGGNQLFEAGLIIGNSSTKVVDVVRNDIGTENSAFYSSKVYQMVSPGPIATQQGYAQFTDSTAPSANHIGLTVDTRSYAFHNPPDTNYIIVEYDIKNTSNAPVSNLYAGLFFDWDMLPNYATNKTAFDTSRNMGYAWDDSAHNPVYCGTSALDTAASYRALVNDVNIDLSDSAKWHWLSDGIVTRDTAADIHLVVSEGPYSLAIGATQRVAFGVIAGNNLSDLQRNADFAKEKWKYILPLGVSKDKGIRPVAFSLLQNYPNPFNPTTNISYDIPASGKVTLSVFDVLGQLVSTLVDRDQQAGRYHVQFNGSSLPSGVYFYRIMVTGGASGNVYTDVKKLLLLR
ncbi:MAG: S8/S53 family peptidase [Bacteroidota bacterium]